MKFGGQVYFESEHEPLQNGKKIHQLFSFQTLSKDRIFFFISTNIKHDLTNITAVHLLL